MRNRFSLYPRLAATNLRKNRKFYFPYLLTGTVTVMMFLIMTTLASDPVLLTMRGGQDVKLVLTLGCVVIGIFSAIILFYTNSVLTKQRKREFGLYNILGMEKRHIGRVLLFETLYTLVLVFGLGVAFGVVFSKLMQLLLIRILGGSVPFGMNFNPYVLLLTVILFCGIYFVIFLNTLRIIHLSRPIELLHGSREGEKEPRSHWLLALLGLVSLGAGYTIALTVKDAVEAITYFFVAVLLVIIGTYLLFIAFSIVFLKGLKKNKRYYYQTRHFPTVSGMLYRMKRNAAGLASICILSTMVLVTVSTTVCLYIGTDSVIDGRYPYDFSVIDQNPGTDFDATETEQIIRDTVSAHGQEVTKLSSYYSLLFAALREGDELVVKQANNNDFSNRNLCMVWLTDAEGYTSLTGNEVTLEPDEMLYQTNGNPFRGTLRMMEETYRLTLAEGEQVYRSEYEKLGYEVVCLVVADMDTLRQIESREQAIYSARGSGIAHRTVCDFTGSVAQKAALGEELTVVTKRTETADGETYLINRGESKQLMRAEYLSSFGAFFFLGMFLGLLFLLATVLIIYYKQVSEGYDDRERFRIMQKVGMTGREVRAAIRSQVLTVFFLPLLTAAVHIAFAFPMIRQILAAFGLSDMTLFLLCTLATFCVFALIYVAVYLLTAAAYYRIVNESEQD